MDIAITCIIREIALSGTTSTWKKDYYNSLLRKSNLSVALSITIQSGFSAPDSLSRLLGGQP